MLFTLKMCLNELVLLVSLNNYFKIEVYNFETIINKDIRED